MDRLLIIAVPFAIGIGVVAGIAAWITFRKRASSAIICLIVMLLCVAYYVGAIILFDLPLGFILHRLLFLTLIIPWGYGFGQGTNAFLIAVGIQTGFSSIVAIAVVMLISMSQWKKGNTNNGPNGIRR